MVIPIISWRIFEFIITLSETPLLSTVLMAEDLGRGCGALSRLLRWGVLFGVFVRVEYFEQILVA